MLTIPGVRLEGQALRFSIRRLNVATVIYFFSGTGNSFKIAEALSKKIGNARVIPVSAAAPEDLDGVSSVGLVFPVLMFGIPLYVRDFLKKTASHFGGKYAFFVASNGGNVAGSFSQIARLVKSGHTRSSYHSFVVPRKNFNREEFDSRVDGIAASVATEKIVQAERRSFSDRVILTGILNVLGNAMMRRAFTASEKCSGCGSCYRICPANNITMVDGKPRWSTHCNVCYGCVNWCQAKAIQAKLDPEYYYRSPLVESASELHIR